MQEVNARLQLTDLNNKNPILLKQGDAKIDERYVFVCSLCESVNSFDRKSITLYEKRFFPLSRNKNSVTGSLWLVDCSGKSCKASIVLAMRKIAWKWIVKPKVPDYILYNCIKDDGYPQFKTLIYDNESVRKATVDELEKIKNFI